MTLRRRNNYVKKNAKDTEPRRDDDEKIDCRGLFGQKA